MFDWPRKYRCRRCGKKCEIGEKNICLSCHEQLGPCCLDEDEPFCWICYMARNPEHAQEVAKLRSLG